MTQPADTNACPSWPSRTLIVERDPATGREQIVYYDIGVGAPATYPGVANALLRLGDKLLGGGRGAGFEGNVEDALGFLAFNHLPGDEVFIFGFSRGAATAQAVTRFIDWAGGWRSGCDPGFQCLVAVNFLLNQKRPW